MGVTRAEYSRRPNRESLTKRLGKKARQIRERDSHRCVYCGAAHGPMHLDHVVARNRGGSDTADNLVVACASCNSAKQDMTVRSFYAMLRRSYGWTKADTTKAARRVRRQLSKPLAA
jgi:5-methylcytosine-specific restriction endonuclease McrA